MLNAHETFPPVTLGHIRGHGCRDLLVYCGAINCSHHVIMSSEHFDDDTSIRPLGRRMVCSRCGPPWRRCAPRLGTTRCGISGEVTHAANLPRIRDVPAVVALESIGRPRR